MTCATALVVTIFISLSLAQSPSAPDEVISNCVEAANHHISGCLPDSPQSCCWSDHGLKCPAQLAEARGKAEKRGQGIQGLLQGREDWELCNDNVS